MHTHIARPLCAILGALAVALAAGPSSAAESAKALLNKGNRLFSAGDYQAAYEAFKQGYDVNRREAVFLRSMGYSLLKLYQHEKARDVLRDYVNKFPGALDKKKIEEVMRGLDVVVQTRVSITSTPPGAELFFDVEAAGKVGVTPFTGTIEPGKHTIILRLAGYHLTTKVFAIQPKESVRLALSLEVPFKLSSTPAGASVHIDSEASPALGVTPYSGGIAPGKRTVFLKLAGYKTFKQAADVPPARPFALSAELPLGIRVTSTPAGATVEVDGKATEGPTPVEVAVPVGKHAVAVKLEGYRPFAAQVDVAPGKDNVVDAKLEGGLLSMRTNVAGARVTVGSAEVGAAPLERATVPLGKRTVAISAAGKRPWTAAIDFEENQLVEADVKLGGPLWPLWTAVGVTGAGLIVGAISGGIALKNWNDATTATDPKGRVTHVCDSGKNCDTPSHVATTGFVLAGTAAAFGLIYYLVTRPSQEIKRLPATRTAGR